MEQKVREMLNIWKSVDDRIMASECDAEWSMPEQPFPKTPSVRESDSIMDANMDDDNSSMDGKEDESDEDINGIVHDQPVLTCEGVTEKTWYKNYMNTALGRQVSPIKLVLQASKDISSTFG